MSTEPNLVIVHSEVGQTTTELEEQLSWVSVSLVLLDCVFHCLFSEAILEFKGGEGKAVDEDGKIKSELGLILAVLQLPRDAEDIVCKAFRCLDVAGRGCAEEEIYKNRAVLNTFSQDIHHSPLGYFSLEPCQKLESCRTFGGDAQLFDDFRLG